MSEDEFHVSVLPGTTVTVGTTLTLQFDSPSEADNVILTLLEVDEWGAGNTKVSERAGSNAEKFAEFKGQIKDGKYRADLVYPKNVPRGGPRFSVFIDGGESHKQYFDFPIPKAVYTNEDGIYEVIVSVQGKIKKKMKKYVSESPVFIRNFKSGRPVVAFITGKGGEFFTNGSTYWKKVADGTFERPSLESIYNFLLKESDRRKYGPWGDINILSHGNEFGIITKLFDKEKNVRFIQSSDIKKAKQQEPFTTPLAGKVDQHTRIIFRGCSLGRDQPLLDELKTLFGGVPIVLAPRYVLTYYSPKKPGDSAREGFMEYFFVYTKGDKKPSDRMVKSLLSDKYANHRPQVTDTEWDVLLRGLHPNVRISRVESYRIAQTYTFTHDRGADTSKDAKSHDFIQDARNDWRSGESTFNTEFDEWEWSQGLLEKRKISDTKTEYKRVLTGKRYRSEVRRELKKDGELVKPSITNSSHFGRSPLW